ncbi:glycosyltransferase family 4 protein [Halotalea alkalilenta]|uniref:glycosyltransferase family 4 protein n=1 Tax=Halotalea alkalilenta TaxID=376489 RepID=UPI0005BDD1B3|nr:glycosyltransferase family 1 protein [Halotalea alkalilenta]
MHIADMTMFYAPSSGGVRTYLEAKRLRIKRLPGMRHTLLVPRTVGPAETDPSVIRIPAPPLPFSNGYRFPLRRKLWCAALRELKPSLIEAGDPYVTGWAAIDAGRELDIPVIGFYHSDLPEMLGSRFGMFARHRLESYVRRLYGHYERVLAPSRVMADKLIGMGVERVHVQPLGVDSTLYHPDRRDPEVKRSLGLADDTRLLVFAGRGSQEKNLPILIETMKLLGAPYHLLMVGSHMPTQVPDNVSVVDRFVPQSELARLFASADALLHAGTHETFGLVVLEAMSSGLPVVVARAGALEENVDERFGRLCNPLDPLDMARATRELFEEDVRRLGRRARSQVERYHGWDAVVEGVVEHYRDALGVTAPAAAHEAAVE